MKPSPSTVNKISFNTFLFYNSEKATMPSECNSFDCYKNMTIPNERFSKRGHAYFAFTY